MKPAAIKSMLVMAANRSLGAIGEQFITHQCRRLGFDIENLTGPQLEKLALEAKNNSLLMAGRVRAERVYTEIMRIITRLDET